MSDPASSRIGLRCGEAQAEFSLHGGELMSWRIAGRELIWHGDPAHWSRRAPILFPVVGASADAAIQVEGRSYPMPQHGFARDSLFTLEQSSDAALRLRLVDGATSRSHYPFAFALEVAAELGPETLSIAFTVTNRGEGQMPYALGFHPAFPWPLDGAARDGHTVVFEAAERSRAPEVAAGGLLARETRTLPFDGRVLALDPALFSEALVFLEASSRRFDFVAPSGAAIAMTTDLFPHLAVWSRPTAPFLSLEAWTGHADWADATGELRERASMALLAPGAAARHAVTLTWHPPSEL